MSALALTPLLFVARALSTELALPREKRPQNLAFGAALNKKDGHEMAIDSVLKTTRAVMLRDQGGQSIPEYAVVMSVVMLIALAGLGALGGDSLDVLRRVSSFLH